MKFSFDEAIVACTEQSDDLIALDEALIALSEVDSRKAQLVETRHFGGLSNSEIADALDISLATVKRDWTVAKAWLLHALRNDGSAEMPDRS